MLDLDWTLLTNLTLIIGLPIIVVLLVMVWRRTIAVTARIREVREEMARNPQDPYRALSELMSQEAPPKERGGTGGRDG